MSFTNNTFSQTDIEMIEDYLFNLQGLEVEDVRNPSQNELDALVEFELISHATLQHYYNAVPTFIAEYENYLNNRNLRNQN